MSVIYNRAKYRALNTGLASQDLRVLVLAGASVPAGAENPDLNTVSELLAVSGTVEASTAGYARQALAGEVSIEDDALDVANLDASDPTWAAVATGDSWRAMVTYVEGGSDSARELLFLQTLPAAIPTNGGGITLTVASNGLLGLT